MRLFLTFFVVLSVPASMLCGAEPSCATLARQVGAAVRADRERVLIIVEDSIVQNETCTCEIVKAAIQAARADDELVGQIVLTAASCSPGSASIAAECALAAAPEAADEVKRALERAFDGKPAPPISQSLSGGPAATETGPASAADGKSPAGGKPVKATPDAEITLAPVSIGGVYLIYPGGSPIAIAIDESSHRELRPARRPRPRLIIIRPPDATPAASNAIPNG